MRISRATCVGTMLVAAALLVAGTEAQAQAPTPTPTPTVTEEPVVVPAPWKPDVRAAKRFARGRVGGIAFSIRTPKRAWHWHADRQFHSASVLKAMLLVAYLRKSSVRGRSLRRAERALLSPMIRRSANGPASTMMGIVGTQGLKRLARRAGMRHFVPVMGLWGASRITARDQSRYFLRIDHLVPRRHRDYAMRLLRTIVSSQRWGIARVRPRGWRLYFKSGWGSGTGAVDNQVALLTRGQERVSLAIMTRDNGSHAYARRTLRGIARRLLRGLPQTAEVP